MQFLTENKPLFNLMLDSTQFAIFNGHSLKRRECFSKGLRDMGSALISGHNVTGYTAVTSVSMRLCFLCKGAVTP